MRSLDRVEFLDDSLEAMLASERIARGVGRTRPLAEVLRRQSR